MIDALINRVSVTYNKCYEMFGLLAPKYRQLLLIFY